MNIRICLITCSLLFLLTACGSKGAEPPVNYDFETGDSLPGFSVAVALPEDMSFSEEEDKEAGTLSYRYDGLGDAGACVAEYVEILEEMYTCSVTDSQGAIQPEQTVAGSTGDLYVGADAPDGSGILQLRLVWDETSCTVTPAFLSGLELTQPEPSDSLTIEEAVAFFQGLSPSRLNLSGSSMSDYEIYPGEGLVMVDNIPCIPVNLYFAADHSFAGSYLLSFDGSRLYQVNRGDGQVTELPAHA